MILDLLELFGRDEDRDGAAVVVGVCGFPLTGKTTLARALVGSQRRDAVHLPTESAILSRDARSHRALNGCAAEAHDLPLLGRMIVALRAGIRVSVPRYEWFSGDVVGADRYSLDRNGLIVVDGSVACEPEIASLCDVIVFILPQDSGWMEAAVQRDVKDRFWRKETSRHLNVRKAVTVAEQYRRQRDHIDLVLGCSISSDGRGMSHQEVPRNAVEDRLGDILSASSSARSTRPERDCQTQPSSVAARPYAPVLS